MSLKEKQERQRQEEIEDLQKSNEELLTVISVSKATRAEEQTMETVEKTRQEAVMVETEAEESGYEMDFDSGSSDGELSQSRGSLSVYPKEVWKVAGDFWLDGSGGEQKEEAGPISHRTAGRVLFPIEVRILCSTSALCSPFQAPAPEMVE